MAVSGPTLAALLATVPPLLPMCMPCNDEQKRAIKNLRLVSKEMSGIAGRAARRFSVQLGERACMKIAKAVQLMRLSQLEQLTVTIITTPARLHCCSLADQLATCSSQLGELLQGLSPAVRSVTALILNFTYQLHGQKQAKSLSSQPVRLPCYQTFSHSFGQISHAVCAMLAQALPMLHDLRIEGCCEDAAFDVFGAFCPQLTHLQFDPTILSYEVQEGIYQSLGSLVCVTLKTPRRPASARPLQVYVEEALSAFQKCKSVSRLVLDFDKEVQLSCNTNNWRMIPGSVRELVSHCALNNLESARPLIGELHNLSIHSHTTGYEVNYILQVASKLKQLNLYGEHRMNCSGMLVCIALIRHHLLRGLQICMPSVLLRGTSSEVQSVLEALPELPSVHSCTLSFEGCAAPAPFTQLSCVFPTLIELHLFDQTLGYSLRLSLRQLHCLSECKCLKQLRIQQLLGITIPQLVGLCMSMSSLEVLQYVKQDALGKTQLGSALRAQGHKVQIQEYT